MKHWFATAGLVCACCLQLGLRAEEGKVSEARELYQRAAAALLSKNLPVAAAELAKLVESHPEDELAPLAALRLAECHLAQSDAAAASELLETWLPKLSQSPRTVALEPTAVLRAHYIRARADFAAEKYDLVMKVAREQADVHARRSSVTAAENGLLDQLRDLADQASRRREQALGAQLRSAADQVRNKQYSEALCTLEPCDPDSLSPAWRWRYHVLHAQCLLGQGDAAAALEELDGIALAKLTEQERSAVCMACLEAALAAQKLDRAQAEIDALAATAKNDEQLAATVALRAVEVAMLRKDRQQVRRLAEAAKEAYPKFAALYEFDLLLARNAIAQIEFAEARQILSAIIQSPPTGDPTAVPRAQWLLGESYFLSRDYARALVAYTAVIDDGSAPAWTETALIQRGKCYELLSEPEAARADYERLLEQFPRSSQAAAVRQLLAELDAAPRSAAAPPAVLNK
ncbi:MAG: tetratricopeptide repeat protein [Aureliella sp.]